MMKMRILAAVLALGLVAPVHAGEDLVSAVRSEDAATALRLIEEGADVNARSADGTTPLHWAAYNGDVDLVDRLIEAGAEVNTRNDYGASPMSAAAMAADPDIIEALLDAGGDPESPNPEGQTALMVVARSGNVEAARLLLEAGADVNVREEWRGQTALMWAAARQRPEMVELLLEYGADPDIRSRANDLTRQVTAEPRGQYRHPGGLTALLYAARQGCDACARNLAEGGADLDRPDPRGVTPLIMALDNLHFDTAKVLIEAGANVDKWDWWGRTPLYMAVDMNTLPYGGREDRPSTDEAKGIDIVHMLLEAGADPNPRLKYFPPYRQVEDDRGCDRMLTMGATPLLRAAKTFDVPAIRALLEHGANVNLGNTHGLTPVMAAAGRGSIECDVRGGPGYLEPGVQEKSIAALEILLEAGADINARDMGDRGPFTLSEGKTALHGAGFWGWTKVAKFLVEHGARIDAQDKEGMTPVDSAMGRAGGHGRGQRVEVYEDTANVLKKLCAEKSDCTLPEREESTESAQAS